MENYSSLPANSEESHYEYPFSHQESDATGYLNPSALNSDDANCATIKDYDIPAAVNFDDVVSTNYLELTA